MPAPTAASQTEQIIKLQSTIENLTKSVDELSRQMFEHNTRQEPIVALVNKHETLLYGVSGDKSRPGLVVSVADLEKQVGKTLSNIERAVWVIVTALLMGVGVTIWEALKAGLIK